MAADAVLVVLPILGSMSWNTAEILCGLITLAAFAVMMVIAMLTVVFQARRVHLPSTIAGTSARSLTGLAAFAAGRQGPALFAEWNAHLAGDGHAPASWAKVRLAAGFVIAGARCRCSDWSDAAWRPVDAVLRSRTLSNLFVLLPTGADAYVVLRHEGTLGLLTTFESIFVCGVMLYGVIKAGRWYRDVEPPEPKARQARKQDRGT
jgi:hypothetical protein